MMIELNDREMAITKHALEFYMKTLRSELGKTKKRDWKKGLHDEKDVLDGVLGRLH